MQPFRVGISSDFAIDAKGLYEAAVEEVFGPHSHISVEAMPPAEDDRPSREIVDRYDGILALATRFDAANLRGIERLAAIARWGVGFDRIDTLALNEANAVLAITPNAVRRPVAEAAIAMIFACTLNLVTQHKLVEQGLWRGALPRLGRNIAGRALGSVGLGNIACEMFRMARSMGFGRMLAHDPYAVQSNALSLDVELCSLERLFTEADFVCVHCSLSEATRHLVDEKLLRLMKPTAFLINTARGPIVDEAALVRALDEGWIAGAALDVFEVEPLPADAPIRKCSNAIFTPHGIAWTEELARDNSYEACRNLLAVAQGKLPGGIVNRAVLDRPQFQQKLRHFEA